MKGPAGKNFGKFFLHVTTFSWKKIFIRIMNHRYFKFLFELPSLKNVFNLLLFIINFQIFYPWKVLIKTCMGN